MEKNLARAVPSASHERFSEKIDRARKNGQPNNSEQSKKIDNEIGDKKLNYFKEYFEKKDASDARVDNHRFHKNIRYDDTKYLQQLKSLCDNTLFN